MGKEKAIDVLKLYLIVRENGGLNEVSRNGMWGSVAEAYGLSSSEGCNVKSVYAKYLEALDTFLQKINLEIESVVEVKDGDSSGLNPEKKDGSHMVTDECAGNVEEKIDLSDERRMLQWLVRAAIDPHDLEIGCVPDCSKWKSSGNENIWKQILMAREAMLMKMIIHDDEKPATSSLNQNQNQNQKVNPRTKKDSGIRENVRCSPRLLSAKLASQGRKQTRFNSADEQLEKESGFGSWGRTRSRRKSPESAMFRDNKKRKRVMIGKSSQAEIPEWKEGNKETYEYDPKWISDPVWPLKNNEHNKFLIERERIGKGRQDSCGCEFPGSVDCVRFHVGEKKARVKLELCSAFEQWGFDKMGENVALSWVKEDEEKFAMVIKDNTPSVDESFWNEIFKAFPGKSREELVSYYFNVFILQRRSQQNRSDLLEFDSDDDKSNGPHSYFGKSASTPPGSILSSPKKPQVKNNGKSRR